MTKKKISAPKHSNCPKCEKQHEVCADGKTCSNWRTSYEVCMVFGTRPLRVGFDGAAIPKQGGKHRVA